MLTPPGKIKILSEGIANRIAAGEVVERPASVVKELIENALDAGATEILVAVKKAGFDEILVTDNGWGMDDEDLLLAFRRHATSKLDSAEDLLRITHLGFRGEALPSVASVSRVEVLTKRDDRPTGFRFKVDGGKATGPEPAATDRGSSIRVRSLFYNVPARRKFLRTPATEYNHIVNVFRKYALSYPEIKWTLKREDDTVWDFSSSDLRGRIGQMYGEGALSHIHTVEGRTGDMFIEGVVGGGELFRKSRGDQFFFINKRPFISSSLHHAVINGFGPLIHYGQFPLYVLFLRLDPEDFDVNVHPSKHEVRFRDERQAYRTVLHGIRDALGNTIRSGESPVNMPLDKTTDRSSHFKLTPQPHGRKIDGREELDLLFGNRSSSQSRESFGSQTTPVISKDYPYQQNVPKDTHSHSNQSAEHPSTEDHHDSSAQSQSDLAAPLAGKYDPHGETDRLMNSEATVHESTSDVGSVDSSQRINVWQLHRTYILSQVKSGLVVIDQHVAHERILYEKAIDAMKERPWNGQQLLFPVEVELTPDDSAMLEEIAEGLGRMGFDVEHLKGLTWQIRSFPAGIKVKNESKLLKDILRDYRNEHELRLAPEEALAASFACKAAIKKGDPLNLEEMNALIDDLFLTRYPFVCPHGRPVVINLSMKELNKLFLRE
ncbi:DNA mismatch repair endonuclease MutL [bacterium]|nr:DNA mismatch repair endonuclease MutL [bacterium]